MIGGRLFQKSWGREEKLGKIATGGILKVGGKMERPHNLLMNYY